MYYDHMASDLADRVIPAIKQVKDLPGDIIPDRLTAVGERTLTTARLPELEVVFEAGGKGVETGEHAASLTGGRPGVLHGNRTYLLQDKEGQITEAHSISAGLDYPGIGPEHSWLKANGRVEYVSATDDEAVEAFQLLCKLEGIIPALESAHAVAHVMKLAPTLPKDNLVVVNLSGRGDKDVPQIAARLGIKV